MKRILSLLCIIQFINVYGQQATYSAPIVQLTDAQYPDDPSIGNRHTSYGSHHFTNITFTKENGQNYDIRIFPQGQGDTIFMPNIKLIEYIPTIQQSTRKDDYLSYLSVVNQEWNRNQVRYYRSQFTSTGQMFYLTRVDIARNCLNAYLWEIILYADENGKELPYYHGWFDFPKELYADLFFHRNGVSIDKYLAPLENWVEPESKVIDLNVLRIQLSEKQPRFEVLNQLEYPLKGEREKKFKNILYPKNTTTMEAFLTDKTAFATFSPPGFYNTKAPRKTTLSRLAQVKDILVRKVQAHTGMQDTLLEIEVIYDKSKKHNGTKLVLSGIFPDEIPSLDPLDANNGWMSSMGIGNHTFYETYNGFIQKSSKTNPYFCLLMDENNRFLDSHFVGIDGPLLHWDNQNPNLLHIWILSFERHAFVGHYTVEI